MLNERSLAEGSSNKEKIGAIQFGAESKQFIGLSHV